MNEISYRVKYNPPLIVEIGSVMRGFDLGIEEIFLPVTEIWSWKTTTKITTEYKLKMKIAIEKAIINMGGKPMSVSLLK